MYRFFSLRSLMPSITHHTILMNMTSYIKMFCCFLSAPFALSLRHSIECAQLCFDSSENNALWSRSQFDRMNCIFVCFFSFYAAIYEFKLLKNNLMNRSRHTVLLFISWWNAFVRNTRRLLFLSRLARRFYILNRCAHIQLGATRARV